MELNSLTKLGNKYNLFIYLLAYVIYQIFSGELIPYHLYPFYF